MSLKKSNRGLSEVESPVQLNGNGKGRKFIFLINPISGIGKKDVLRELIAQRISKYHYPFEISPTTADGDYSTLAKTITSDGITDVIICGGDGTVNSVVSQLMNIPVNIGIIPMGSGNGLALAAGIPKGPSKALDIILKGNTSLIDGFYINNRFSCMLCGMGFDAQVAHDFARQKRRGLQTYIRVSAINFFKASPYSFEITCSEGTFREDAFLVCVANSNQFGNNFTIAPKASLNDGLLDIVVVRKMNKIMIPFSIISQATGINALERISEHIKKKNVLYFQTSELTIKNPGLAPLHIDGDPVETAGEFHIRLIKKAFRLLHP
ncbi:diacylglycerol/lipid kinase family protein [Flavitalea antarctica]